MKTNNLYFRFLFLFISIFGIFNIINAQRITITKSPNNGTNSVTIVKFGSININTTKIDSITVSASTLTGTDSNPGTPGAQLYIAMRYGTYYQICETLNGTYSTELYIDADASGNVSSRKIYVKFIPGSTSGYQLDYPEFYDYNGSLAITSKKVDGTALLPLPTVTTTDLSSITSTTASSGGTVDGYSITARGVCWNTTYNPVSTDSHTTDGSGTGVYISSIPGLSAKTLYYVRAYATNATGTAYGSNKTLWTLATEPSFQTGSFYTGAITSSSIELNWSAVATADGYIILQKKSTGLDAQGVIDGYAPTSLSFPTGVTLAATITAGSTTATTISGLQSNTTYYYVILPYAKGTNDSTYNYKTDGTIPSTNATTNASAFLTSSGSGNWGDASTWGNVGIPGSTTDVTIQSGHTVTVGNVYTNNYCHNLIIQSGAALTLNTSKNLTVSGNLTLQTPSGTGTAGSLIDYGTLTVSGTVTVQRYLSGSRWWYISSPVSNATASTIGIPDGSDLARLFTYDVASNTYTQVTNGATALTPMQGFSFKSKRASETFSYTGTLNTGSLNINLTAGGKGAGWNLVGNPYPSAIDWDASSGWTKTNISNQICYRSNSVWATYNGTSHIGTNGGTQYIPAMQGFWVKDTVSGGALALNNNVRVHNSQSFYKSNNDNSQIVRLKIQNGSISDETVIGSMNGASNTYDAYDSDKFFDNDTKNLQPYIYSKVDKVKLAVNIGSPFDGTKKIPIFIKISAKGNYIISSNISNGFTTGTSIILKDLALNKEQDLKTNPSYSFYSDLANDSARFEITIETFNITVSTQNPICNGDSVKLTAPTNSNFTYQWELNGQTIKGATSSYIYAVKTGDYQAIITDISTGKINKTNIQHVIVNEIPISEFTINSDICAGIVIPIIYSGIYNSNASYYWDIDGGNMINGNADMPFQAYWTLPGIKNISLYVTENGCTSQKYSMSIKVKNIPSLPSMPNGNNAICNDGAYTFYDIPKVQDASAYLWTIEPSYAGSISGNDTIVKVFWKSNFFGNANISVKSINECGISQISPVLDVEVYKMPKVNLGNDTTLNYDQTLIINAGKFASYLWSNGSTEQSISAKYEGDSLVSYSVTVTDFNGCTGIGTKKVTFKIPPENIQNIKYNTKDIIKIQPTITKGEFDIIANKPFTGKLFIINYIGQKIFSKDINIKNGNMSKHFDISNYPKGLYFIKIISDKFYQTEKIILE